MDGNDNMESLFSHRNESGPLATRAYSSGSLPSDRIISCIFRPDVSINILPGFGRLLFFLRPRRNRRTVRTLARACKRSVHSVEKRFYFTRSCDIINRIFPYEKREPVCEGETDDAQKTDPADCYPDGRADGGSRMLNGWRPQFHGPARSHAAGHIGAGRTHAHRGVPPDRSADSPSGIRSQRRSGGRPVEGADGI